MLADLDKVSLIIAIDRVSKHQFTFLVNGTIERTYRKRDSCNRRLKRIYMQHYPEPTTEPTE